MPENATYVGRPSKFGNPFKLTNDGWILCYKQTGPTKGSWCYWSEIGGHSLDDIIWLYEKWITGKLPKWLPKVPNISILKGKDLACFCPLDKSCHADVLIELCN